MSQSIMRTQTFLSASSITAMRHGRNTTISGMTFSSSRPTAMSQKLNTSTRGAPVSPSTASKSFHIRLLPTNFRLTWLARSIIDCTTSSKLTPGFAWYLTAK